ncbi:hypothetical protein [Chroococcidiopsis sp.]|uniref:hypothetical protein n=1 Tax=Chroococcidiopsis sp. TaxID=3088168 RepID=UPI003F3FA367
MEAILYQGQFAAWCKGGCGRFRKPHCYVENSPICCMCARSMELELVTQPKFKRRNNVMTVGSGNSLKNREMRVADRLLKLLVQPQRSSDLAQTLGCNSQHLTAVARNLIEEGKIIAAREQSKNPKLWYALPEQREQLIQLTTNGKSNY